MLVSGGQILAIDKVNHDSSLSGDGVFYPLGVNQEGRVYSAGSGIKIDDENVISISADYVSATELEKYYKKTETSAASEISAKFDEVTAWTDETFLKEHQSLSGISAEFSATSAWALKTFQPSGDYYQKFETSSKEEIQNALNLKQDVSGMSAYQLSGDYVSASDFNTYKELVKQEFTNTSAWATSSFQPSGKYITSASNDLAGKNLVLKDNAWTEVETDWTSTISAASANAINSAVNIVKNKFNLTEDNKASGYDNIPFYHQSLEDYYKKSETSAASAISAAFKNTSAWANETFQPIGEYISASEKFLSANALDNVSGAWNSVVSTVESNSANWNEASAFAANSAKFVTSAIEQFQDNLSYFLAKSGTSTVWSGVDLSDLDKPLMSGYGTSAWYDETQGKYFVSANIVGNHGVSAKYDANSNTWDVGISANDYSFLFGHYSNNEVLTDGTILKLDSNNYHDIEIDEDGFITLPETTNKFTFCVNEYIDDNISQEHNYLLNKLVLSAKGNDQIVASQNYYPAEVGSSNVTLALTIDATTAPNREYCIVYKGSDVAVNKLHVEASILEEVTSLDSTAGAAQDYTGRNPIRVVDNSKIIELLYDSNVFSLKRDEALQADVLTIEGTGGEVVNKETFDKLLNSVNGRIVETIPIGAINQKSTLGADCRWAYVFRPMIEFNMDPTTTARIITGNASANQSTVIVAVYELDEVNHKIWLQWWSAPTVLTKAKGEHVLSANAGCTDIRTIYPDRLYYVTVLCYAQQIEILGETNELIDDIGDWDIAYVSNNLNTDERRNPVTYNNANMTDSPLGVTAGATLKPYVGFKNVINE